MTMNFVILIVLFMIMIGLSVFISLRKHLLTMMFSLEFITVNLFFMFFLKMSFLFSETYFLMLFLVFTVCEGVLGLGVLINLIRCHGNDKINSVSGVLW
uniref:NADH-ubiquinone oxidoreductase chain 4L n=1 Tax=Onymocoris hackeri TaxID=2813039 RepID=A0A8T9ZYL4_9HEMI|nr:NADH dehydrogenase subunit 4L [Onymocoris hackeri]